MYHPSCRHTPPVAYLQLHIGISCPTALFEVVAQTQFVDPYLRTLATLPSVAHPYHDGFHVGERGVTHYGDGITGVLGVGSCVAQREVCLGITLAFLHISLALKVGKVRKEDGHFIFVRPHGTPVCGYIGTIKPIGRELERYGILVVIIAIIASQTDENGEVSIPNSVGGILYALGMRKEL